MAEGERLEAGDDALAEARGGGLARGAGLDEGADPDADPVGPGTIRGTDPGDDLGSSIVTAGGCIGALFSKKLAPF